MKKLGIWSLCLVVVGSLLVVPASAETQRSIVMFQRPGDLLKGVTRGGVVKSLQADLKRQLRQIADVVVPQNHPNLLWAASAVALDLTAAQAAEIARRPGIKAVIPTDSDIRVPPFTGKPVTGSRPTVQWGVEKILAPQVWDELKIDGSGIVVGHLDTGVAAAHPAFAGQILQFRDFTMTSSSTESFDDQGHGSHSAGSIVGRADGIGVAPGAKLIVGKIFNKSGGTNTEWIMSAMQWMLDPDGNPETDDAPHLVSNSWGSSNGKDRKYWDIVQAWVAAGIVPVFSAGNSGYYGASTIGTPAAYPHSFAIGATTNTDTRAAFSSRGPVTWEENGTNVVYIKPDVSAPGQNIVSANFKGGLTTMSGTSMSGPHAAGLVALIRQANPTLGVQEVIDLCSQTCIDLGPAGKDNDFGYGRINAYAAVGKALTIGRFIDRLEAANHVVAQERALSANLAANLLSGPYVRHLIEAGNRLAADEFSTLSRTVAKSGSPLARKILGEIEAARAFGAVHGQ